MCRYANVQMEKQSVTIQRAVNDQRATANAAQKAASKRGEWQQCKDRQLSTVNLPLQPATRN